MATEKSKMGRNPFEKRTTPKKVPLAERKPIVKTEGHTIGEANLLKEAKKPTSKPRPSSHEARHELAQEISQAARFLAVDLLAYTAVAGLGLYAMVSEKVLNRDQNHAS